MDEDEKVDKTQKTRGQSEKFKIQHRDGVTSKRLCSMILAYMLQKRNSKKKCCVKMEYRASIQLASSDVLVRGIHCTVKHVM